VALGENFKAKHGRGFVGGDYSQNKLFTKIHKLFVSTPNIAPIGGGVIVDVNVNLQLQMVVVCK
jgi:hypothetical protein